MKDTKLLGSFGEALTAEHLRKKGYRILGMNYRTRLGEIDVIASKGGYVAFVEVKLRKSDGFAQAREFVTRAKQQRVIAAAQEWLQQNACDLQPRFDVMEVYAPEGVATREPRLQYWENAFSLD